MALCINRRCNEHTRIYLPDGRYIRVTISRIKGTQVGLAFEAPADVRILREELAKRVVSDGRDPLARRPASG